MVPPLLNPINLDILFECVGLFNIGVMVIRVVTFNW
jgi:hypothetical protein